MLILFSPVSCLLFTVFIMGFNPAIVVSVSLLYFLLSDFCLFITIFSTFSVFSRVSWNLIENLNQILRCFLKTLCSSKYFWFSPREAASSEPWGGYLTFELQNLSRSYEVSLPYPYRGNSVCPGWLWRWNLDFSGFIFPCGKIWVGVAGGDNVFQSLSEKSNEWMWLSSFSECFLGCCLSGNNWLGPEAGNVSGLAGKV